MKMSPLKARAFRGTFIVYQTLAKPQAVQPVPIGTVQLGEKLGLVDQTPQRLHRCRLARPAEHTCAQRLALLALSLSAHRLCRQYNWKQSLTSKNVTPCVDLEVCTESLCVQAWERQTLTSSRVRGMHMRYSFINMVLSQRSRVCLACAGGLRCGWSCADLFSRRASSFVLLKSVIRGVKCQ